MSGASPEILPGKPAVGRLSFLRRHIAFLVLAAIAIPATVGFCWHSVVATIGDDSVSYLTLARYLTPWRDDPLTAPWAGYFSNLPPLFPLLLVFTGGAYDLFTGHMVVAAGAVASLILVYAYALYRLADDRAALAVTVLFLMLPGAWLGLVGILTESTYLAICLAALLYEAKRVRPESPPRTYAVLGLWMAAALLTRTAGVALILGYCAQVALRAAHARRLPAARAWLPLAVVLLAQGAWLALRPTLAVPAYQHGLWSLAERWSHAFTATWAASWEYLARGWVGVFLADAAGGMLPAVVFAAVALVAFAGAARAALRGRLDGWYVLASLAMLFLWVFNEDNSRRLLYPLLPLVLLHAAEMTKDLASHIRAPLGRWLAPLAFALLAAIVLPATALILRKSLEREPYFPDLAFSPASMTRYYGIVNEARAREEALRDASALGGLSYLGQWTAPGVRVMWVRPEYIAVLVRREGIPLYLRWDRPTLAREIRRTRTDFVVASSHFKNDMATDTADAFAWIVEDIPNYLVPLAALPDVEHGEYILLRVDAEKLGRYLREIGRAAESGDAHAPKL